jgi:hypothetical protein
MVAGFGLLAFYYRGQKTDDRRQIEKAEGGLL